MAKGKAVSSSPDSSSVSIADLLSRTSITTTMLDGNIFLQYSAAMRTFLVSKEKLKYIEEPADTTSSEWIEDAQV